MARAKVDDKQFAVVQPKFVVDALDERTLFITPDDYEDLNLHSLLVGFPEHKWRRIDGVGGWAVPITTPNIDYLKRTWKKGEYSVTETANILMTYEDLTVRVDKAKAQRRWEYIFNDKPSDFVYPAVRPPFMHQRVAVEAAYGAEYFGHLMEMGTGKTKCIIDEASIYITNRKAKEQLTFLVVCPKSLITNWTREIKANLRTDLFYMSVVPLQGDMKSVQDMMAAYQEPTYVKWFIVSYDSVPAMLPQLSVIKPTMLVCDESHYIKSSESKRWKALRKLADVCSMRRILTGTPISNTILDVWAQFEILRPGALGFNNFNAFKKEYCSISKNGAFEKIEGFKNVDKLKENMSRMSFIVRKDQCLDLPDKMYETRRITMPDKMSEIYHKFASDFSVMLDNGLELETEHIIVQMLKLSQICAGIVPASERWAVNPETTERVRISFADDVPDGWEEDITHTDVPIEGADAKLEVMIDDVCDVVEEGSKLIVWSRFRRDNRRIQAMLTKRGVWCGVYDGGVSTRDKQDIIDAFNNNDDFKVIIANAGSGGVGLTLLGTKNCPCHTAFYYNNDFNYGKRSQSEDRNHRIGQTNKVLYRDYVYAGSIEEYICAKLRKKRNLSDSVKDVGEIKAFLLNGVLDDVA